MEIVAELGERHIPNIEVMLKKLDFLDKRLNYSEETSREIAEIAYYIRRENKHKQELIVNLLKDKRV